MINSLNNRKPGFLQNIVCVDSPVEPGVHAEIDHPPKPIVVLRKQLSKRVFVAVHDAFDQFTFEIVFTHDMDVLLKCMNCHSGRRPTHELDTAQSIILVVLPLRMQVGKSGSNRIAGTSERFDVSQPEDSWPSFGITVFFGERGDRPL